jgi:hypothetical protein
MSEPRRHEIVPQPGGSAAFAQDSAAITGIGADILRAPAIGSSFSPTTPPAPARLRRASPAAAAFDNIPIEQP